MADIEKKIKLNIISNAKENLDQFKLLEKTSDNLLKQMTKFARGSKEYMTLAANIKQVTKLQKEYERALKSTNQEAKELAKTFKDYKKAEDGIRSLGNTLKQVFSGNLLGGIGSGITNKLSNLISRSAEKKNKLLDAQKFSIENTKERRNIRLENKKERLNEDISNWQEEISDLRADRPEGYKTQIELIRNKISEARKKYSASEKRAKKANLKDDVAITNIKEKQEQIFGAASVKSLKMSMGIGATVTALQFFGNTIKSVTGISLSLADAFKDVISTAGKWMDMTSGMATYATGSSLITNANARRTQLKYGLSESQTFAFDEATRALNIQSDEDIAYMNSRQREVFSAFMDKYSKFYDEMQSSGVLDNIQQMQLDFYMFKQELAMDFMNWFAENKDWILNAVKGILSVMKGIFTIIGWIVEPIVKLANFFGGKYDTSELSDTLSASAGYSDSSTTNNMSNKTNNINVTMTNNATGVLSSQNALEDFYREQMERTAKQLALELE